MVHLWCFLVLQNHLKTCEHRETQCTQCGQYVQFLTLLVHQSKECPMRPEKCVYCGKDVPHQQMEVGSKPQFCCSKRVRADGGSLHCVTNRTCQICFQHECLANDTSKIPGREPLQSGPPYKGDLSIWGMYSSSPLRGNNRKPVQLALCTKINITTTCIRALQPPICLP